MKLGNFLVKAGVLNRAQLDEALQHQVLHGARLGTCLVELGMLSIDTLAQQLAQFHGVPVPGRQQLERVQPSAARRLTRALVEKRRVLPLRLEGTSVLHVAMLDPHDPATLDDVRFVARARIVPYVLPELVMHDWLEWLFQVPRGLRYVDMSRARPAQRPAAQSPAPRPGTLRGVGVSEGIDMGRWDGAAQAARAGDGARGASLPSGRAPAENMARALEQVVPMAAQEPVPPSVLSVPPPVPRAQRDNVLSEPPPRGTKPPPALVLPDVLPAPPRAPAVPEARSRADSGTLPGAGGRKPGGGTLPGAGSARPVSGTLPRSLGGTLPGAGAARSVTAPPPVPSATLGRHTGRTQDFAPREAKGALPHAETQPAPAEAAESVAATSAPAPAEAAESATSAPPPASSTAGRELAALEPDATQPIAAPPVSVSVATWAIALEAAVVEAEDRDALVDAALRLGGLYAEVIAVFAVHRGMVQGVRALGPGGEIEGLNGILIDEATPCHLTAPVTTGEALRYRPEPRSVDERVLHVMGRQAVGDAAVFPVRLKRRTVSLLYADNGGEPLPESCFGALEAVARCMAAGFERLILNRRRG